MKKQPDHQSRIHAKLSASGSSRWLNCPGSVNAEENYPNDSSVYAEEGTLAHELADICLSKGLDAEEFVGKEVESSGRKQLIEKDMARYVQEYLDYVRSHEDKNTELMAEQRVDFSRFVPEGFGTLDAAVLNWNTGTIDIFDLKYGKGVMVHAFENPQAQLYGLGLHKELEIFGDFNTVRIHIVQPRLYHTDVWEISVNDLLKFGHWAKERADLALSKNAPRVPGEKQCQWCKDAGNCAALAKFTEEIISADFDDLSELDSDTLTDEKKRVILDHKDLVEKFLKSVEFSVYKKLADGDNFEGYKLVEGRSNRKFTPEGEEFLKQKLGSDAYKEPQLIGITEASVKLTKEEMEEITTKPKGKPTLTKSSDKRKPCVFDEDCHFEDETKMEIEE